MGDRKMTREIKFRAWDTEHGEFKSPLNVYVNGVGETAWQFGYSTEPYSGLVLQQYTGLKDCNGKEIYEGDLLKTTWFGHTEKTFRVEYLAYRTAFKAIDQLGDGYCLDDMEWEVIGNLYENKELLNA
jgi:uncharacterized phage protein (TIGR01671 family)